MWSDFCFGKIALAVFWLFIAELQAIPILCGFEQPPFYYVFLLDQEHGQVSAGLFFCSVCLSLKSSGGWSVLMCVAHWFRCLGSASFPYGLCLYTGTAQQGSWTSFQCFKKSFSVKVTHALITILIRHFSK